MPEEQEQKQEQMAAPTGQTAGTTLLGSAGKEASGGPEKTAASEIPEKFRQSDGTLNHEAILKSYGELEKRLGAGEAPPKTATDYKLDYKLPEGVELNKETEKAFLASCHAKNMTNTQVQFVMDRYLDILGSQVQTQAATVQQAETELKKSWGAEYDQNLQYAVKAYDRLVDAGDNDTINRIGNDPVVLKILAKIGKDLKEDTAPTGGLGMMKEDVQALMRSPAYWNAKDPEHARVKAKVEAYFKASSRRTA